MNAVTLDSDKQVFQNYITELQTFTFTDYNVTGISFPQYPKKDSNGNWVS